MVGLDGVTKIISLLMLEMRNKHFLTWLYAKCQKMILKSNNEFRCHRAL